MTKPVIVTRAIKGAPLTRTELDNNFTNINDAVIIVTGDTGSITNSLNESFQISGGVATTSKVVSDALIIDLDNTAVTAGSYTLANITVDAQGRITAASNGSGSSTATNLTGGNGTTLLGSIPYQSGTNTTSLLSPNTTTTNKFLAQVGDGTNGFAPMWQAITTLDNVMIGSAVANTGRFTTLTSTGRTVIKDLTETISTVTYSSTITPDVANGTVQKVTLTGNVTFSAFSNPVTGQSLTLIITQDATGSRTLTSTMKFSGASKTLSTAANAIDIITVFYDGTNYYASLGKGFA